MPLHETLKFGRALDNDVRVPLEKLRLKAVAKARADIRAWHAGKGEFPTASLEAVAAAEAEAARLAAEAAEAERVLAEEEAVRAAAAAEAERIAAEEAATRLIAAEEVAKVLAVKKRHFCAIFI